MQRRQCMGSLGKRTIRGCSEQFWDIAIKFLNDAIILQISPNVRSCWSSMNYYIVFLRVLVCGIWEMFVNIMISSWVVNIFKSAHKSVYKMIPTQTLLQPPVRALRNDHPLHWLSCRAVAHTVGSAVFVFTSRENQSEPMWGPFMVRLARRLKHVDRLHPSLSLRFCSLHFSAVLLLSESEDA